MNYHFITGTSRGIGKAIAEALLQDPENRVTGLSRSCSITHERYTHVTLDLSDTKAVSEWKFTVPADAKKITLLNNSGIIGKVGYAGKLDAETIDTAYRVNLISATLLCNTFLETFAQHPAQQVIINVSSGAGKNPVDGWSVYCATKAGLDMFTRTVAAELKLAGKTNTFIFAVAPGVVDTAMQEQIRESDTSGFSRKAEFVGFKNSGLLSDPGFVAQKYIAILGLPEKFPDVVFSVKDI